MLHARHALIGAGLLGATPATFAAAAFAGPTVAGIPIEFIFFAATLLGVALFHHHTMPIALGGAALIAAVQDHRFAVPCRRRRGWVLRAPRPRVGGADEPFPAAARVRAAGALLRGKPGAGDPAPLSAARPRRWLRAAGARVRAVELPRRHRGGDDRRRRCGDRVPRQSAHRLSRGDLPASNQAAGSVVGDTTTTMMWISGVTPGEVVEAYWTAGVVAADLGTAAARQQHALRRSKARCPRTPASTDGRSRSSPSAWRPRCSSMSCQLALQ